MIDVVLKNYIKNWRPSKTKTKKLKRILEIFDGLLPHWHVDI